MSDGVELPETPPLGNVHPDVCVVYLLRGAEVLLGLKLRGLGQGRLVGVGGKLQPGESARHAAVREVAEEVGVVLAASDLVHVASLDYRFPHRPAWSQRSTAFVCHEWMGTPRRSDELDPRWYSVDRIPFDRMWDDARYWLPAALTAPPAAPPAGVVFTFGEDNATVAPSA